jgi:hypothetical protein
MQVVRAFIWGLLERFVDPLMQWVSSIKPSEPVVQPALLAALAAVLEAQVQAAAG